MKKRLLTICALSLVFLLGIGFKAIAWGAPLPKPKCIPLVFKDKGFVWIPLPPVKAKDKETLLELLIAKRMKSFYRSTIV